MHAEELWVGNTFQAQALRTLLTPASWLYAAGWQTYLASYRLGIKTSKEPHSPVVCVGNLQVGGTGKTPAVMHVADVLEGLGYRVAISCSGYGSPAAESARVAPDGALVAREWGDEAALIRWLRPGLPLIVGRRRVLAGELCHAEFRDRVLLMDDGFQHLPLKKHLSLVLDPPVTNHRCLPAGPYREPKGNRSRADLVLPDKFSIRTMPMQTLTARGEPREVVKSISVLCALGRPQGFIDSLRGVGYQLASVSLRPDHDPLTAGNLLDGFDRDRPIVTTGKDWVKLRERADVELYDFAIASHEVVVEPGEAFREWLRAKLDGIPKKTV